MIILDATNESLQMVLAAAITTSALQFTTNYVDMTDTAYTVINNDGTSNNTTDQEIVAAPAASTRRLIKLITIYNADTVEATVTIKKDTAGTDKIYCKVTIQAGDTLQYNDSTGFSVIDTSNGIQNQPTVNVAISANNTSASGGTVVFSNSNNFSFSNNAGTITATYNWNTLSRSFIEVGGEYNANAAATNSAAANVSFIRMMMLGNMTATRLDLLAHLTVAGSTAGSWSILAGVYTRSGNSLFSASSTSGNTTWNSGGATTDVASYSGVSGTRIRTMAPSNWAFTPGEYWFGFINTVAGVAGTTGSVTIFGQSSLAVTNGAGLKSLMNDVIGNYAMLSYRSASFPDSIYIPQELVFVGANAANVMRQPSFRMYGTI